MNTGLVIVNTIDTCQGEKEVRERRKEEMRITSGRIDNWIERIVEKERNCVCVR